MLEGAERLILGNRRGHIGRRGRSRGHRPRTPLEDPGWALDPARGVPGGSVAGEAEARASAGGGKGVRVARLVDRRERLSVRTRCSRLRHPSSLRLRG